MKQARLKILPCELKDANALIAAWHRHHKPVVGHRFSLKCVNAETGNVVGVAVIGRPVARNTCQRSVLEVTRLVTDGTPNACSCLYNAAARAGKEMGYQSIQTFILDTEPGVTLKAAGWVYEYTSAGGDGWQSREGRRTDQPNNPKKKYSKQLNKAGAI